MNQTQIWKVSLNEHYIVMRIGTFSRTAKSHHSQIFNNILRIYMNQKMNFYHHILVRNAQIHIRLENLAYCNNLFINLEISQK